LPAPQSLFCTENALAGPTLLSALEAASLTAALASASATLDNRSGSSPRFSTCTVRWPALPIVTPPKSSVSGAARPGGNLPTPASGRLLLRRFAEVMSNEASMAPRRAGVNLTRMLQVCPSTRLVIPCWQSPPVGGKSWNWGSLTANVRAPEGSAVELERSN
jgi:hypothetical protein